MYRPQKNIYLVAVLVVAIAVIVVAPAVAQDDARFSVDFQGTDLSTALEILKRYDRSFSYTLPSELENRTITASLVDVSLDEALNIMLDQLGLTFVKDNNVYKVREKKERQQGRGDRPMPSYGSPVYTTRPTSPDQGGQAAASTSTTADEEEDEEEMRRNLPPRLIQIKYGHPALLAELFGGTAIYGGEEGGYGGGTSGRSGYGSSSSRGGIGSSSSSGIGSSRSSSRNSSSRSSGSSSRSYR